MLPRNNCREEKLGQTSQANLRGATQLSWPVRRFGPVSPAALGRDIALLIMHWTRLVAGDFNAQA